MIPLLLLLVLGLQSAESPSLRVEFVPTDAFLADVAPGWELHLDDAAAWTPAARVIRLPTDGSIPLVPVPDALGRYDATAWSAFLRAPLNPQRNAVRLLGRPSTIVRHGTGVELSWDGERLWRGRAAGLPQESYAFKLTITNGSFVWEQVPVVVNRMRM